jgi:hypothetical protein
MADAVVDFPLLPVTAITGLEECLKKIDRSVSTGTFFDFASFK